MNLHKLIEETWNASWFFKVWVLFVIGSVAWTWISKWRRRRLQELAENWPMTMGRVVSREIKEKKGESGIDAFVATLTYSYFQEEQQPGTYRREFDSQEEAGAWLDLLFEKEVPVHFDPAKPSRSTLIERELPSAIALTSINSGQSTQNTNEPNRWTQLLALASLMGLAACAVLHVLGLVGTSLGNGARFDLLFAMQIYAIAVFVGAWMLERNRLEDISVKRYRAEIDALTPETLRWTGKLIYVYGIGWFAVIMIQSVLNHDNGVPLAMFTAFQAIFLFEAYRMTQMERWRNEARLRNEYGENR